MDGNLPGEVSMFLRVSERIAALRWMMNSNPSALTSLTVSSLLIAMSDGATGDLPLDFSKGVDGEKAQEERERQGARRRRRKKD